MLKQLFYDEKLWVMEKADLGENIDSYVIPIHKRLYVLEDLDAVEGSPLLRRDAKSQEEDKQQEEQEEQEEEQEQQDKQQEDNKDKVVDYLPVELKEDTFDQDLDDKIDNGVLSQIMKKAGIAPEEEIAQMDSNMIDALDNNNSTDVGPMFKRTIKAKQIDGLQMDSDIQAKIERELSKLAMLPDSRSKKEPISTPLFRKLQGKVNPAKKDTKNNNNTNDKKSENEKEKEDSDDILDLSAVLNILDGTLETPGRIIILTSNYPEKLDQALIRPGRIDLMLEFKKANHQIIREMYECYLEQKADETKIMKIEEYLWSPAEVSQILFKNYNNPEIALDDLINHSPETYFKYSYFDKFNKSE
jgi:hypothetical protein